MNKLTILERVTPLINQTAQQIGLIVLEVNFIKERGQHFLRIYIYSHDKPISHAECSDLTRKLSNALDESNIIDVPYSLEVSSPGVNRKLKYPIEFEVFKGKEVKIILKGSKQDKIKEIIKTGKLIGLSENKESALIEINNAVEEFKLANVRTIQLEG